MKRYPLQVASMFAAMLLLSACAALQSIGVPQPETFNQKLAVGYGSVVQVRETAKVLLEAKKISVSDAQHVQQTADVARAGLDTALALKAADPNAAMNKLDATRVAIQALLTYLATKGSP